MYYETFDVVTAPDGSSSLRLDLSCATASDHYRRCTDAAGKAHGAPCATGLRVYAGAHVLSAFLCACGRGLLRPGAWAVELGCGCGLAGLTAALRFPSASVALTDAAEECLALARDSAGRLCPPAGRALSRCVLTHRLEWSPGAAGDFREWLNSSGCPAPGRVRLVLGSDLFYYRIDIRTLLGTCRALIDPPITTTTATTTTEKVSTGNVGRTMRPLVVLSHFMRIPNGKRELQSVAYALGMGVVRVPLDAIVSASTAQCRGWNGIMVAVLFVRASAQPQPSNAARRRKREAEDLAELREILRSEEQTQLAEALAIYSEDDAEDEGEEEEEEEEEGESAAKRVRELCVLPHCA